MDNLTTTPTIAELWREADELIRLSIPHLEKLVRSDDRVHKNVRPIYADQIASCKDRLQYLRQQLRERCTTHDFNWLEPQSKSSIVPQQWLAYHRDNAAYHAFWAWEIEQRLKEAQNEK